MAQKVEYWLCYHYLKSVDKHESNAGLSSTFPVRGHVSLLHSCVASEAIKGCWKTKLDLVWNDSYKRCRQQWWRKKETENASSGNMTDKDNLLSMVDT